MEIGQIAETGCKCDFRNGFTRAAELLSRMSQPEIQHEFLRCHPVEEAETSADVLT